MSESDSDSSQSTDDGLTDDEDDDTESVPPRFTGDFFGEYTEDDFNYAGGVGADSDEEDMEMDDRGEDAQGRDSDDESVVGDGLDEAVRPHWEAVRSATEGVGSETGAAGFSLGRETISTTESNDGFDTATHQASDTYDNKTRERLENGLRKDIIRVLFPSKTGAGKPLSHREQGSDDNRSGPQAQGSDDSEDATINGYLAYEALLRQYSRAEAGTIGYAPFAHRIDWQFALWAKLRGPSSTAVSDLLSIEGVPKLLGLSYTNVRQLNALVDLLPSERPKFKCEEITVGDEAYELYFRDVIACVRALYGDPGFARHLVFLPERHYSDPDQTMRLYHDMYTGKWWWAMQKKFETSAPGATIIPVIISSDKTQVTLFRNKAAYPLYLTIGNIPKDIRSKPSQRGHILLGYLPTTKLEQIKNKAARRRTLANLIHACIARVLEPLEKAGADGVEMVSGDGAWRRTHPLVAADVCDYPEQVLHSAVTSGQCVVCTCPAKELGNINVDYPLRDIDQVLAIHEQSAAAPAEFIRACGHAGIKPIFDPFWKKLPHTDIFLSITPDILHQLHQGVVKHLVSWVKSAYGPAEIDARCRRLPPNHNIRLFFKGITSLSRLTGREHADICRILLGVVTDLGLPDGKSPARLIRAIRAILDFVYLAQYPLHSTATLDALEQALADFHANKAIFVELGIRAHFHFPKLHFLRHYRMLIERLGTADNFNTEYTERLHIDFAKDAYRATNKKDEFPQMTLWLERKEKILRHADYIDWCGNGRPSLSAINPLHSHTHGHVLMTRFPSAKAVPFTRLQSAYGATDFKKELARFILCRNDPSLSRAQLNRLSDDFHMRLTAVPVYHKAKFWEEDFALYRHASDNHDVMHAIPSRLDKYQHTIPGRFDTALVNTGTGARVGVKGYRVCQIRVIFSIPKRFVMQLFPSRPPPSHLAYVEWFTPFGKAPERHHGMYKISRAFTSTGKRVASVIPLDNIRRSVHLFPQFGSHAPAEWSSSNVLDSASNFLVNSFTDRHVYGTVF